MRHTLTLRYIDAVARTGSFRSAADEISITPSALNRRIIAVEEELGVDLFERTSKGVRLNSAGELFVQHIRTQINDLERVKSRIADLKGLRSGHVRIATTPEIARRFLPWEIQKYRQRFPGVTFEVDVATGSQAELALAEQTHDIAIVLEPANTSDLHTIISHPQQLHCLMDPDHPLAERHSIGITECLEYDLLLPSRGNGIREVLEKAAAPKRLVINPTIESNNLTLLEQMVVQGDGIGFTIPLDKDVRENASALRYVPLSAKDVPFAHLFVGQLRFRALPVAVGKFVEDLRSELAKLSEPGAD